MLAKVLDGGLPIVLAIKALTLTLYPQPSGDHRGLSVVHLRLHRGWLEMLASHLEVHFSVLISLLPKISFRVVPYHVEQLHLFSDFGPCP